MKSLISIAILLLSSPVLAEPASNGAFWNPDYDVPGTGVTVTTSLSGRVSFILYTTLYDCEVKTIDECNSQRRDFTSGLNPMIEGQSQGILSTMYEDESHDVGWYIFGQSGTGYTLEVLCAKGSPIDCDQHVFTEYFDFNTCIVSDDLACLSESKD